MQTHTIHAPNSHAAFEAIMRDLGEDAVVLSMRRHASGVEVTAAARRPGSARSAPSRLQPQRENIGDVQAAAQRMRAQADAIGFSGALLKRLQMRFSGADTADIWAQFLVALTDELVLAPPAHMAEGHVAVVGLSGSGKTTTLAQIAAMMRREQPGAPIAFIAADLCRLGAREQLRAIASNMNIDIVELRPDQKLVDLLHRGRNLRLLIDMPSQIERARQELATIRACRVPLSTIATVPFTLNRESIELSFRIMDGLFDSVALTHVASAPAPGHALSHIAQERLPISYLGRSAGLEDGLVTARLPVILQSVVAALSTHQASVH